MGYFRIVENAQTAHENIGAIVQTSREHTSAAPYIQIMPFGLTSKPQKGVFGFSVCANEQNGENVILGYIKGDGEISDGDLLLYSQDESGVKRAEIRLFAGGDIDISNTSGAHITISPDGEIHIVGGPVAISGSTVEISGDSDVQIQGTNFLEHTHALDAAALSNPVPPNSIVSWSPFAKTGAISRF